MNTPQIQKHDIRLTADGSIIEELTIDDVSEGQRDKFKNLVGQGGVTFQTEKSRKRWFLKFSEFSFLINNAKKA